METHSTFDRGVLAERQGQYGEALRLFQSCLAEDEFDQGEVLFHCGWCIEQGVEGGSDQALRYYELAAAEAYRPECKLNCFFRAGWLLMHRKEPAKASIFFRHAIDYGELSYHKNETYNQSAFWYAVCLESSGRYIEAQKWYRLVRLLSVSLDPESRVRELACLNKIGAYDEAFSLCQSFDAPAPAGFDNQRYHELQSIVSGERALLLKCLSARPPMKNAEAVHGSR